jgi:translation initiation factor IF-3
MELIYKLDEAELDYKLLEAIKVAFKGQKLRITVHAETPGDAVAIESFEQKVLQNAASKVSYVFEPDEFDQYTEKSLRSEKTDAEQFKHVEQ